MIKKQLKQSSGAAIKDGYKTSRQLYIIESALEYFIAILTAGAYIAKLTSAVGMSDGLTGILTAFVSLGCGFQIFALFWAGKKSVKRWVTILNTINQLCFAFIYIVPVFKISRQLKTFIFIVFLLSGHIINNIINSPKTNWFMSLVDDKKRGVFTANKEIISLTGGMVFSFAIGLLIDRYEAAGRLEIAFILCAGVLFTLTILHSFTLIFSKEKTDKTLQKDGIGIQLKALLKNKKIFKVIILAALWNIASFATIPFYGSYQVKELGFSMHFVSGLSILYAVVRSVFSRILGRFADKHTFIKALNICYTVALAAFTVNIFTVPENGKLFYSVYYALYAVAMAGINSSIINLIYEQVEPGQRMIAYALQQSVAGTVGFLTTAVVSILVSSIQKNSNTFLGLNIYAQQVASAIGVFMTFVILVYINTVLIPKKTAQNK